MKSTFIIAKYTFIEAIRDKFLLLVFALMLVGLFAGKFMQSLTLYGAETAFPSMAMTIISLSVVVISVLYVNIATRRELDGRIMHVILTRPVSNMGYLLGKHLGFTAIAFLAIVVAAALLMVTRIATPLLAVQYIFAMLMLHILVVIWSLFFALLLSSVAASVVVSFVAWALFSSTQALWLMAARSPDQFSQIVGKAFYYIMPNYAKFNLGLNMLYSEPVTAGAMLGMAGQTVIYALFVLLLAWVDFSRKEY